MLLWINTHGIESMIIYIVFCLFAGSIPPLPPGAGFIAQWAYLVVKTASANSRGIGTALGIKAPEIQLANIPGMKIKNDDKPKE